MRQILFLGISAILFAGCFSKQIQEQNKYEIYTPLNNKECQKYITISYLGIEVAQKINSTKIAYKENNNKLEYFAKNKWASNLQDMLEITLNKIAKNNCIALSDNNSPESMKLKVLDLYFDESSNKAVFNAILELGERQIWIAKHTKVEAGDFSKIINALNSAINSGLDEALGKI